MGEVKLSSTSTCTTLALRYRFVITEKNGVQFQPHKLRKLKVPQLEPDELRPENVVYEDDDVDYLRSLDPKDWKSQDHYKVLGIPTLRHRATEEIIKTAYRKKVLKHHPDKRKALGEDIKPDDDYFTCITMAYETLGTFQRRRAYDSVDPEFDNNIPCASELKQDFYELFTPQFEMNARWSERQNVPRLGNAKSTRNEVERFYTFWYDFKSWREYSYEDEEDKDKCQDRDERRYVDKINKAERLRKKKEEMARIRSLVDLAYNNDPRIAKFKQDDKEKKLAVKRAKQTAAQAKKDEEDRLLREVQLAREHAEALERARIETKRQEREVMKKALKKERKSLRDLCKSMNYYGTNDTESLANMTMLEKVCELYTLNEIEELNRNVKNTGKDAFIKALEDIEKRLDEERKACMEAGRQKSNNDNNKSSGLTMTTATDSSFNNFKSLQPDWNEDNVQLLVKSVNLFPAGTNQRWEVVANYLNQHGTFTNDNNQKGVVKFNAKLVLAKAKDLQNTDFTKNNLKDNANKQAFDQFKRDKRPNNNNNNNNNIEDISKKFDNVVLVNGNSSQKDEKKIISKSNGELGKELGAAAKQQQLEVATVAWTTTEQQLLEQALKTFPSNTAERWDRIAECIPNRSKKECMKRYKELVETVKAKKAAQAAVLNK